jgi:hypothetical protein
MVAVAPDVLSTAYYFIRHGFYICKRRNAPQRRGIYDVNRIISHVLIITSYTTKAALLSEAKEMMVCKVQQYMRIFCLDWM